MNETVKYLNRQIWMQVNMKLTHCGLVTYIWVIIFWGNGLEPDGIKPLPEPTLTYRQ